MGVGRGMGGLGRDGCVWGGYGGGKVRGEKGEGMKVYIFCLYMIILISMF